MVVASYVGVFVRACRRAGVTGFLRPHALATTKSTTVPTAAPMAAAS